MGSSAKTITIFEQWQKLPSGNLGCSFQMCTYDLMRRKSRLKLMKQVHSSHRGNISTARRRAGSDARSPATLPALCQMLHVARASSRVQSHAQSTWATGAKVWASAGHGLCPSAKLGSTRLPSACLHLCLCANNTKFGPT